MRQQQQQSAPRELPKRGGGGGGALDEAVDARRGDLHEASKRARKQPGFLGGLDEQSAAQRVRQMASSKQRPSDPHLLELQSATEMAAAAPAASASTSTAAAAQSQPQLENNDAFLRQLQENYNHLLTKYALAEVTIDQLRLTRPRAPPPPTNRTRDVFTLRHHRLGGGDGGGGGAGSTRPAAGTDPFNRPFASGRRPWGQQHQSGVGDTLPEALAGAHSEQDLFYDVGGGLGTMATDARYPVEMGGSALLLEAPPSPPPVHRRPYSVLEEPNLERCMQMRILSFVYVLYSVLF